MDISGKPLKKSACLFPSTGSGSGLDISAQPVEGVEASKLSACLTINQRFPRKNPAWLFLLLLVMFGQALYAQYDEYGEEEPETSQETAAEAASGGAYFFTFNYGAAAAWLNRIINQTERSNFVFQDFLAGLYFGAEMRNVPYIIPVVRLAAYYPFISTFNQMPQKPNVPLHFGVDALAGVKFELFDFGYFRLNLSPALHLFFMTADRWNYVNLGALANLALEAPLTARWTLMINGYASIDSGNLGGNRLMEPFDVAYQYQVDIGARYSKKKQNSTPLFTGRQREKKTVAQEPIFDDYYTEGNDEDSSANEVESFRR